MRGECRTLGQDQGNGVVRGRPLTGMNGDRQEAPGVVKDGVNGVGLGVEENEKDPPVLKGGGRPSASMCTSLLLDTTLQP